jgi:hypothetical protein
MLIGARSPGRVCPRGTVNVGRFGSIAPRRWSLVAPSERRRPDLRRRSAEQFAGRAGVSTHPTPRSRASFDVEASPWADSIINIRFYNV